MSPVAAVALRELWSIIWSRADVSVESAREAQASRLLRPTKSHDCVPVHLSAGQAHDIVKAGIPSRSLAPLGVYLGLSKSAIAGYLGLDRVTANRKVAKDERLPTHAAEAMLRLLELDTLAKDTFETEDEAAGWLLEPHPMLGGQRPVECAKSSFGTECVKDILTAIKYGGVA